MSSKSKPADDLQSTLRDWKITATLPSGFRERVWHRIESRETTESPATLLEMVCSRLASLFTRPAFAVSYIAALVAAGLITGYWQAQIRIGDVEARLADQYVQSIDPYHKIGHSP